MKLKPYLPASTFWIDPSIPAVLGSIFLHAVEANVNEELDVISSVAEKADRDEKERMKDSYHVSTRYEYLFWDQAYRMNSWPL